MTDTAKLFMNGRSQAVRLPAAYRFEGDEVYIRRDPKTNDVVISAKPASWEGFFALLDASEVPNDFMTARDNSLPTDKDLF